MTDQPIDPKIRERANHIIGRPFVLDEALANVRAFRAALESLHGRKLPESNQSQMTALAIVRAAITRALLSAVIATFDKEDSRGNRASVGQILVVLDDEVVRAIPEDPKKGVTNLKARDELRSRYEALLKEDRYIAAKTLRHAAVAHILVSEKDIPLVKYDSIFGLHDECEKVVKTLFDICERRTPQFVEQKTRIEESAKLFWDTYFGAIKV